MAGPKHRLRFLCELKVAGYPYTAIGNSTTKKDAQINAAKDFVSYLIRKGDVDPSTVPDMSVSIIKIEFYCLTKMLQ